MAALTGPSVGSVSPVAAMDKAEIIPSVGDRNLGPMLIGVNWAVFGPATILVCLRLMTRIWITRNFGWDDAVIALTQVSCARPTTPLCRVGQRRETLEYEQ